MAKTKRLIRSFYRMLFPAVLLMLVSLTTGSILLTHDVSVPPRNQYLLTPAQYGRLSARGAQVTDETWANHDGTTARGWLLRGAKDAPAVILLHRFGADRSHVLNLGVKISEATNFTVLMPDLRGHGVNPPVKNSTFGGSEAKDTAAAAEFLKNLRTEAGENIVGENIGIYGVELGGLAALNAASINENIKAVAIDSAPPSSDAVIKTAINNKYPFASFLTAKIAEQGTYLYFWDGGYEHQTACQMAKNISNRQVILLGGMDNEALRDSTENLSRCFPNDNNIEKKFDLNPSGYNIGNASNEQSNAYDQRIIEFFQKSFGNSAEIANRFRVR